MAPKEEKEKEKKEKKDDKEKAKEKTKDEKDDKKEKKEKKEKDEKKDEKKEKKEEDKKDKKDRKDKKEAEGFDVWSSCAPAAANSYSAAPGPKAPQDKREKEKQRDAEIKKNDGPVLVKAHDAVAELARKKKEAEAQKKKQEEQKTAKAKKEARREEEARADADDTFQIMDKSGLGNFMEKRDVMNIMKSVVQEATTSAGSRCQIPAKTVMGDRLFSDITKFTFESLGDFKASQGFVYIRGALDQPGFTLQISRPATVFVCLSKSPNEEDPFLRTWEQLSENEMVPPEFSEDLPEVAEVRRKTFKDPRSRNVAVPKPPAGLKICLCFILPDFHAEPFGAEEETEEDRITREREEAAARRAGRGAASTATKKVEEPSQEEKIDAVLEKVKNKEKLTNKEKRLHEKYLETQKLYKNEEDEPVGDLGAFTVILPGGKNEPPAAGDAFVCDQFSLSAPKQLLFDNASITVVQGKRYGILGPNGQGKTTLLRHIAAREMPVPLNWDVILVEQEAKASERSAVEEVLAANTKVADLLKEEEALIQKLEAMDAAMSQDHDGGKMAVSAEEVESARLQLETVSADLQASGADSAEAEVRKILCGLGFTTGNPSDDRFSMDRPVVQFSGGWRMRISLAKALFLQPKLLMLDEPTNHLDLDAVLWLDDYLSEHYPHAVVVVSHDADFLDSICTDILHLEDKKLVHYRGDFTAFKKMHEQKKDKLDKDYKKQQDEIKALKKKGHTKEKAEEMVKQKFGIDLLDDLMAKRKDYVVNFRFIGHGMDRSLGLNVSEVAFSYNGKEPWLLSDVDIGVDCGSRIAIVGPNGAGKSTILKLMMQELEPCEGDVTVSKGIRVRQYHQHFEELLPLDKTGIEYLTSAFNLSPPEKARATLGQFGLPGPSHFTKIGNLSGGQKARVAFAALMLNQPHILVLDEPTNHLDIESVEALTDAISKFNGGLVIVTHDARLIQSVDCELWVVEDGGCYRFEKGFDGYRDKVLHQLQERQEEVERLEKKRREERLQQRSKHVTTEALEAAKKRREQQKAIEDAKLAREAKGTTAAKAELDKENAEKEEEEEKPEEEEDDKEEQVPQKAPNDAVNSSSKKNETGVVGEKRKKTAKEQEEKENKEEPEEDGQKNNKRSSVAVAKAGTKAGEKRVLEEKAAEPQDGGEEKEKEKKEEKEKEKIDKEKGRAAAEKRRAAREAAEALAEQQAEEKLEEARLEREKLEAAAEDADNDEEAHEEQEDGEEEEDAEAKHEEFIIAEVTCMRAIKKKTGYFLVELSIGEEDEDVPVVTHLKGVSLGAKLIFAPEGSTVAGERVVAGHVASEWSRGVICGPAELGWKIGDVTECVLLSESSEVGSAAPASAGSPLLLSNQKRSDEGPEEGEERGWHEDEKEAGKGKKKAAETKASKKDNKDNTGSAPMHLAKPQQGKKGKAKLNDEEEEHDDDDDDGKRTAKKKGAAAKAQGKKGKAQAAEEEDEEDEDAEDERGGRRGGAKKKAPVAKAQGKKGKTKHNEDDDDHDDEDDDDRRPAKKKGAAAKAQGKKGRAKEEEDEEDEEEEEGGRRGATRKKAAAAKAPAAQQGKKGRGNRRDQVEEKDQEDQEEEPEENKRKGGRKNKNSPLPPKVAGKGKGKLTQDEDEDEDEDEDKEEDEEGDDWSEDDDEEEPPPSKKKTAAKPKPTPKKKSGKCEEEAAEKGGARGAGDYHAEYRVAQVRSVDPMKKKKGSFLVEAQLPGNAVNVVTSYPNLSVGQLVILAPEGSMVAGKEVKRSKVAGEWTEGVICGPMELGWPGDASQCVVLETAQGFQPGDFAPAAPGGAGAKGRAAQDGEDEDNGDVEEEEEEEQAAPAKGAKTAPRSAFAALESDEEESEEEEEKDSEEEKRRRKKATPAASAADAEKGKKAKKASAEKAEVATSKRHEGDDDSDEDRGKQRGKKGKRK